MAPSDTTTDLRPPPSREEIDPAALAIMRTHGGEVMAVARRWADTPEDAEDAYQRGLEIMLTKAPSTDPDHLVPWLKTVVKREAWAIRRQRERHTPGASSADELDEPGPTTAHDHAERLELLQRGAEAMTWLKPQEVRALVLKAEGLSYREICDETGWTYTKVNRCLSEGRRRFADRLAGIESGAECDRLAPRLSALADGEASAEDMTLLRPHLRTCLVCRARLRDYRAAPARVAAFAPPVAAGGLLAGARELLAALGMRWHQAAELAAGHKVAAVVASTAALAGGGAVTVTTVGDVERSRPAAAAPELALPGPPDRGSPSPPSRGSSSTGRASSPETAPDGESTAPESPTQPPSPEPAPAGEFTPDAPQSPPPRAPEAPAAPATNEPPTGGEFAP